MPIFPVDSYFSRIAFGAMFDSSAPFPWWLWLLTGIWSLLLMGRQTLSTSSEWRFVASVVLYVYTLLLLYVVVTGSTSGAADESISVNDLLIVRCGMLLAVFGLVSALSPSTGLRARLGEGAAWLGLSMIAIWMGAQELAVLIGLLAVLLQLDTVEDNAPQITSHRWIIASLTTVSCVLWLGLLQHGVRWERRRPAPDVTTTFLPSPATVAKWRDVARGDLSSASPGTSLTWGSLAVLATLIGMQMRASMSETRRETLIEASALEIGPSAPDSGGRA